MICDGVLFGMSVEINHCSFSIDQVYSVAIFYVTYLKQRESEPTDSCQGHGFILLVLAILF